MMSTRGKETAVGARASVKAIFITAVVVLFALFVLQNTEVVEIRFLFWKLSVSRVLMLVGSLAVGCLVGLLIGLDLMRKKPETKQPGRATRDEAKQ
jgi:putative membrane protein